MLLVLDNYDSFTYNLADALRAVNPDWRGMTPYIAYVDGKGGARCVLGEPDERTLAIWLKSKK